MEGTLKSYYSLSMMFHVTYQREGKNVDYHIEPMYVYFIHIAT